VTDDSEKRFNERLGKIAKQKPAPKPAKKAEGLNETEAYCNPVPWDGPDVRVS
jgi:hypothetical protein